MSPDGVGRASGHRRARPGPSYEADLAAPTGTNGRSAPSRAAAVHDARESTQGFFDSELHSKHSRTLRVVQPPHAPTSPACRVIAGRPDPQFVGLSLLFRLLNWTSSRRVWRIGAAPRWRGRARRLGASAGKGDEAPVLGRLIAGGGCAGNGPAHGVGRDTARLGDHRQALAVSTKAPDRLCELVGELRGTLRSELVWTQAIGAFSLPGTTPAPKRRVVDAEGRRHLCVVYAM